MAEKIKQNQFDEVGVNPFNAPIPGESLTTAPDMPRAWERPPQFTDEDDALESLYMELTSDEALLPLIELIDNKTPLDEMAQVILHRGYTQGLWTPDLMLILIEPTIYLLIAIADYAKIDDYVLYEGEEDDPDAEIHGDDVEPIMMDEDDNTEKKANIKKEKPSSDSIPQSLLSRMESELPEKIQ